MKKWLWILIVALPIFAAFEVVGTVWSIGAAHKMVAPRYVEATEGALAQLDSKTLAKASAGLLNDHKKMAEWWRWAQDTYELVIYVLLGLVFLFAAILGTLLWRMPSKPALNTDAGHAPRTG